MFIYVYKGKEKGKMITEFYANNFLTAETTQKLILKRRKSNEFFLFLKRFKILPYKSNFCGRIKVEPTVFFL